MPLLLAREQDGELEFAGPAILKPPSHARAEWAQKFAAMSIEGPAIKGLRRGKAQWLRPELRVRVQHLKARGCCDATVKHLSSTEGLLPTPEQAVLIRNAIALKRRKLHPGNMSHLKFTTARRGFQHRQRVRRRRAVSWPIPKRSKKKLARTPLLARMRNDAPCSCTGHETGHRCDYWTTCRRKLALAESSRWQEVRMFTPDGARFGRGTVRQVSSTPMVAPGPEEYRHWRANFAAMMGVPMVLSRGQCLQL
jgi:hypothetical protein